jgi:hypothetical protein
VCTMLYFSDSSLMCYMHVPGHWDEEWKKSASLLKASWHSNKGLTGGQAQGCASAGEWNTKGLCGNLAECSWKAAAECWIL